MRSNDTLSNVSFNLVGLATKLIKVFSVLSMFGGGGATGLLNKGGGEGATGLLNKGGGEGETGLRRGGRQQAC